MLVTQQKVLRKFWYAIVPIGKLDDGPFPFTLLGEKIVLWKDENGDPCAIRDRCCHRTARLSKGFVDDGNIVCGYHGWTYDKTGACVRIPQMEDDHAKLNGIRIESFRCKEACGYAWVALEEPLQDIPEIPEESMPGVRRIDQFYEIWNTSSVRFLENAFDNSHFSYVHRETFGQFESPKPSRYEINEHDWGFDAQTEVPIQNPPESHVLTGTTDPETIRYLSNNYYVPFTRRFGCSYPGGLIHTIINCATPIDDDHIALTQWLYRNDTEEDAPAADLNAFDRKVTDEDRDILEATESDVCIDVSRKVEEHMPSDRPGLIVRKLLTNLLAQHGEVEIYRQAGNN